MEKDRLGAFIDAVEKISQKTVWSAIVMLFFSSFYPYATKLIADAFFNKAMQGLYGVVVLLITFSVLGYYKQLYGKLWPTLYEDDGAIDRTDVFANLADTKEVDKQV